MELRAPSAMNVFCQQSPDVSQKRIEYEYNNDNLIMETSLIGGDIYSQTFYTYHFNNQLASETYQNNG